RHRARCTHLQTQPGRIQPIDSSQLGLPAPPRFANSREVLAISTLGPTAPGGLHWCRQRNAVAVSYGYRFNRTFLILMPCPGGQLAWPPP
ncbi:hypothetical protein, partial [Bordetella pertussis]